MEAGRAVSGMARKYQLRAEVAKIGALVVLWPEQILDVRRLSGTLSGQHVEIADRLEVGLTFNLWGFRNYYYLFPLRSFSAWLSTGGHEIDISRHVLSVWRTFADTSGIEYQLAECCETPNGSWSVRLLAPSAETPGRGALCCGARPRSICRNRNWKFSKISNLQKFKIAKPKKSFRSIARSSDFSA